MNSKNVLSLTNTRKRIFELVEEVQKPEVYYTLTENGKPKAVLMSAHQFDSLMEDLEILSDPGFAKRMESVEKEFERGEYVTLEELKKELNYEVKKEFVVMEKTKRANRYIVNKRKK